MSGVWTKGARALRLDGRKGRRERVQIEVERNEKQGYK